jgi:small-conductance mechanosensitive channel
MDKLRDAEQRPCAVRRSCVSAAPVPVAGPLLASVAVIATAAVLATIAGLSSLAVLAVTAAAAIGSAHVARRTINSLLAGTVLVIARPFSPGEPVRLYVPERREVVAAEIVRIGAANTTLATPDGPIVMPNSRLLRGFPEQAELDLSA